MGFPAVMLISMLATELCIYLRLVDTLKIVTARQNVHRVWTPWPGSSTGSTTGLSSWRRCCSRGRGSTAMGTISQWQTAAWYRRCDCGLDKGAQSNRLQLPCNHESSLQTLQCLACMRAGVECSEQVQHQHVTISNNTDNIRQLL